jgi:hypothetical protein
MTTVKALIEDLQKNFKPEDEVWVDVISSELFAEDLKETYGVTLPLDVWKEAVDEVEVEEDGSYVFNEIGDLIREKLEARGIELKELEA